MHISVTSKTCVLPLPQARPRPLSMSLCYLIADTSVAEMGTTFSTFHGVLPQKGQDMKKNYSHKTPAM